MGRFLRWNFFSGFSQLNNKKRRSDVEVSLLLPFLIMFEIQSWGFPGALSMAKGMVGWTWEDQWTMNGSGRDVCVISRVCTEISFGVVFHIYKSTSSIFFFLLFCPFILRESRCPACVSIGIAVRFRSKFPLLCFFNSCYFSFCLTLQLDWRRDILFIMLFRERLPWVLIIEVSSVNQLLRQGRERASNLHVCGFGLVFFTNPLNDY